MAEEKKQTQLEELESNLQVVTDPETGEAILVDADTGEPVSAEVAMRVIRDPLAGTNTQRFKAHPPGKRLYWCNELHRETGRRGWRGFVKVTFQDEIGKNLDKYIDDPPRRQEGRAQLDNFVRRGDTVLCWLPVGVWLARQNQRVRKANQHIEAAQNKYEQLRNAELSGRGLRDSARPRRGFVMPSEETAVPSLRDGEHVRTRMKMIRDIDE